MKRIKTIVMAGLCLLIVFTVFSPCLNNGFTNFDDDTYVIRNHLIRDLSLKGVVNIFAPHAFTATLSPQLYIPLVLVSYACEYHFFGLAPFFYHLTNIILHLLNCVLVFWLIFILTEDLFVAFIVAMGFGIHPVQVESVAWIAERKNVLYVFFFLSALFSYVLSVKRNSCRYYYAALIFFIASLFSKPAALVFPLTLLACDYFMGTGNTAGKIIDKLPFLLFALGFFIISDIYSPRYVRFDPDFSLYDNMCVSSYAVIFYLKKILLPTGLSCLYPFPLKQGGWLPLRFLLAPWVVIALVALVWQSARRTKKVMFGALFFLSSIIIYLQIRPNGAIFVADRYLYISSIGLFIILAYGLKSGCAYGISRGYISAFSAGTAVIVALGVLGLLSWQRCAVWKNSATLWNDAVKKYSREYIPDAYFNRAVVSSFSGNNAAAQRDFDRALELFYKKININNDSRKDSDEAFLSGGYSEVYNSLGVRFAEISLAPHAIILFERAIEADPLNMRAHLNLCSLYGNQGHYDKAIDVGKRAANLFPGCAEVYYKLATACFLDNQRELACLYSKMAVSRGLDKSQDTLGISEKCKVSESPVR